jgi:hypothetical protein
MTANSFAGTNSSVLRSFYKYDLSTAASGIPAGATITSAKLRMKLEYNSATNNIRAYRMAPVTGFTVGYTTATRNTYNGTTAWTGGANAAGDVANSNNDYLDTPDADVPAPAVGTWVELDVTPSVQAWVNGTANNGWLIVPSTGTIRTSTPADTQGSTEYPELEVTYQ